MRTVLVDRDGNPLPDSEQDADYVAVKGEKAGLTTE